MRWFSVPCGLLVLAALASPPRALAADCAAGTLTAAETAPGSGLWRYCLSITWDITSIGAQPSHFDMYLNFFASCPGICTESSLIHFDDPAGSSSGIDNVTGDPCTSLYQGTHDCDGDRSLPGSTGPLVKWDVIVGSTCEPDLTGSGTFCFLSPMPPGSSESHTIVVATGPGFCTATVTGTAPSCAVTPNARTTWGLIKLIYR